jgi:hypothetical protein
MKTVQALDRAATVIILHQISRSDHGGWDGWDACAEVENPWRLLAWEATDFVLWKSYAFWGIVPCSSLRVIRRCGEHVTVVLKFEEQTKHETRIACCRLNEYKVSEKDVASYWKRYNVISCWIVCSGGGMMSVVMSMWNMTRYLVMLSVLTVCWRVLSVGIIRGN